MAAVTTMVGSQIAVLETDNAADTVTALDHKHAYELTHTGVDAAGAAAADPITISALLTPTGTPATDTGYDGGTNKYILIAGKTVPIGPGVFSIAYRVPASGAEAIISVSRTPQFFRS